MCGCCQCLVLCDHHYDRGLRARDACHWGLHTFYFQFICACTDQNKTDSGIFNGRYSSSNCKAISPQSGCIVVSGEHDLNTFHTAAEIGFSVAHCGFSPPSTTTMLTSLCKTTVPVRYSWFALASTLNFFAGFWRLRILCRGKHGA